MCMRLQTTVACQLRYSSPHAGCMRVQAVKIPQDMNLQNCQQLCVRDSKNPLFTGFAGAAYA